MDVYRIINSIFNSNTFIVCEDEKAIIIDIGDFSPLLKFIEESNLKIEALFITHTHYDHIYGIREFIIKFPNIPIYTSEFGKAALNKSNWNFSRYHNDEILIDSDSIKVLSDGTRIPVLGEYEIESIETPGHDKSSLSFRIGDLLFTGDSYIPGVKVIASFPNSNKEEARKWYEKLKEMSQNMNLYPGHGDIIDRKYTGGSKNSILQFPHSKTSSSCCSFLLRLK